MVAVSSLGLFGLPFGARTFAAKNPAVIKAVGGLIKKKARKQWYMLPNGIRVLATSEHYAKLAAQYEVARKREPIEAPAEIAAEAPPAPVEIATVETAPEVVKTLPAPQETISGPLLGEVPVAAAAVVEIAPVDTGLVASLEAARVAEQVRREDEARAAEIRRIAEEQHRAHIARLIAEEDELIVNLLLEAA